MRKRGFIYLAYCHRQKLLISKRNSYILTQINRNQNFAILRKIPADEEADDIFCQRMVENYENDPDPEKN